MTPVLRDELVAAGTSPQSSDAVLSGAETLRTANVSQESFKGTKKTNTAEAFQGYNDIYEEVTGKISKPACIFFPGSLPQQQLLSYNAIIKAMNKQPAAEKKAVASHFIAT